MPAASAPLRALPIADWQRLNRLLEEAFQLEPRERRRWVELLHLTDGDLLPLLRRLLAEAQGGEAAAPLAALPRVLREMGARASDRPGDRVGPYRLLRELAQGGMGVVWLAERADGAFEREVAMKLPRAEWLAPGMLQRMARERRILAGLNHPHIAQLHDAGLTAEGRPFLALEYVVGEPIDAYCARSALDPRARIRLFVQVIETVAFAHARLVVHRDLKPSNVMVTAGGSVKLLDFGIAKLLEGDATSGGETAPTEVGARALTLPYAAPEQILGQPISAATDVYALGVMLYELLCGARPYRPSLGSRAALEEAIVNAEPAPPSRAAADRGHAAVLRGDIDTIVMKALKKAPAQRYESATAFADDLSRFLSHQPVRARPDSRWYWTRKFVVRNRAAIGAASAVAAALVATTSAALWQAGTAREAAEQANTIKEFVLSTIKQGDPVASVGNRAADLALLTAAESRIEAELSNRPELALEVRLAIGAAYANRGEYARAGASLRKAIEEARRRLPHDNLTRLAAQVKMADQLVIDGAQAEQDLDAAIATLRGLGQRGAPLLVDALLARHKLWRWTGNPEAALKDGLEALALARSDAVHDDGRALVAANDLAATLSSSGRATEALQIIEPAYRQGRERAGVPAADPRLIEAQSWYGRALCHTGNPAAGLPLVEAAERLARQHHGAEAHITGVALMNLAFARHFAGDLKHALGPIAEAHRIAALREPVDSHLRALRRTYAIELSLLAGNTRLAEQAIALTPFGLLAGPERFRERLPWINRAQAAWLELEKGLPGHAEPELDEVVAKLEGWQMTSLAARYRLHLATALLHNGKLAEAEAAAGKVVQHFQQREPRGLRMAQALGVLGEIDLAAGRCARALERADEVLSMLPASPNIDSLNAAAGFLRGKALLRLGRADEAHRTLAAVAAYWRQFDPELPIAAETTYWHGLALSGNGDAGAGRRLVAESQHRLAASPIPRHTGLPVVAAPPRRPFASPIPKHCALPAVAGSG